MSEILTEICSLGRCVRAWKKWGWNH